MMGVMRNNLVGITPQSSRVGIRDAVLSLAKIQNAFEMNNMWRGL